MVRKSILKKEKKITKTPKKSKKITKTQNKTSKADEKA